MTPSDLRALRKRLGMTQAQLAEALDLHRTQIVRYEGGAAPIPRVVTLACATLAISGNRDRGKPSSKNISSRNGRSGTPATRPNPQADFT